MAGTKLADGEVAKRVDDCHRLRYEHQMNHLEWTKHCHQAYGDKSEKQYTQYWMKAGERYTDTWREKLSKLLDPAVDELIRLLASDDNKIRSRAIDQIMKYNGEDITRVEGDIKIESIDLKWGNAEEST
tara:strand:+ start:2266 stop:2652 length:387 start_codon:yes stop_codon:yes gene_type:complete